MLWEALWRNKQAEIRTQWYRILFSIVSSGKPFSRRPERSKELVMWIPWWERPPVGGRASLEVLRWGHVGMSVEHPEDESRWSKERDRETGRKWSQESEGSSSWGPLREWTKLWVSPWVRLQPSEGCRQSRWCDSACSKIPLAPQLSRKDGQGDQLGGYCQQSRQEGPWLKESGRQRWWEVADSGPIS